MANQWVGSPKLRNVDTLEAVSPTADKSEVNRIGSRRPPPIPPWMRWLAGRLGRALVTVAIALMFAVVILEAIPGDAARKVAGSGATEARVEEVRIRLGLNDGFVTRTGRFVADAVRGDLGRSLITNQPVSSIIWQRLPPTLSLVGLSTVIGVIVGIGLGAIAALRPNRLADRLVSFSFAIFSSVPGFVIGYLLIFWFAVKTNLLPAYGYVNPSESIGQWLHHLIAPSLVLSLGPMVLVGRQLRGAMIDSLAGDTARFATARGLRRSIVVLRHALRPSLIPILSLLGVSLAFQLSGAVVAEQVFNIQGLGTLATKAVSDRNFPVMQGIVVSAAVWVTLVNIVTDSLVLALDPRLRMAST